MTSVTLDNVVKYYYPQVGSAETKPVLGLDHVNLQIEDGETVSIVGPSGCGKSTMLKVIAGLEFADEGRLLYNNIDVTNITPQDRGVGMVFQDYALYPTKEGAKNMSYYFEVHHRTEEEKQQQIDYLRAFWKRNEDRSDEMLQRLRKVAIENGNLFAELMETVKYCSLGQITHALYEVGGQYRRNM